MTQEITKITVIPGRTKVLTDYQRGDIGKPILHCHGSKMRQRYSIERNEVTWL